MADMLADIFTKQKELNARIGVHTDDMAEAERVKWLLNYTRALNQENAELIDSVPWKWWAKYQTVDWQNARIEIVDMLHFLVSLALTSGMTAEDMYGLYMKKNQLNHQRQDTGYAIKDELDNKAL